MEYSQIFKILKTKIDDLISDKISDEFDNASSGNGKEVEHKSYSGFIPYTDGGYEYTWFEYLRDYSYGNLRLPTDKLIKEADGFVEYNLELARENFAEKYPEITERLGGVENVYYSNLEDADYRDEAEELQDMEYNSFDEDTVMMEVAAYYYKPDNSRAIDNKHTIYVFGTVNLEAPYHRHGNNDDSLGFEFTFDSLGELKKQMNRYLKEIHAWFNGEAISKKKPKTDETKTNYSSFFSQYGKGGKTNFMNTRKMMYGGDTYDEGDAISRAKSKAFFEHDFVADAIEYVGGIDEWNKLSESEKQSIIADEERGWNERFSFSRGGLFGVSAKVKDLSDEFGSDSLVDELKEKLGVNSDDVSDLDVIAFAYTDYGGDFFDKVAIAYFLENYPDNIVVENTMYNGENAFVFGEPAKEFMEQTASYPLGFEYLEGKYGEMQTDVEHEGFTYFIEGLDKDKYDFDAQKVFDWLVENKSGYYSVLTSGLDYSESDLIEELENEGIIEEIYEGGSSFFDKYAKGGLTRNEILKLYHKDSLSDAENEKINNAIEKGIIDTDDIRQDNMAYIYTRIEQDFGDEVSEEMIWDFTDENLSNGQTYKENYENLLEYLKDTHGIVKMGGKNNPYSSFFSQFAKGGTMPLSEDEINSNIRDIKTKLEQGGLYKGCVEEYLDYKLELALHYKTINTDLDEKLKELLSKPNNIYGEKEVIFDLADFDNTKTRIIFGDADFKNSQVKDLGNLQTIGGEAFFGGSQFKDLGNLQTIGRSAFFGGSQVKDLGNLQTIGVNASFRDSQIKDLGNLQTIGGNAYFMDSQVQDLGNLQTIGGSAYLQNSQVKDLGKLVFLQDYEADKELKAKIQNEFAKRDTGEYGEGYYRKEDAPKTPYSSFFSQFAKGGKTKKNKPSLNYTHPLDIRILEAVYYDRIDALMGILPYYLKGADRYFNEQKRGNANQEIAKIYNKIDENYQDLAELSANGFPIDLNVSHKMALDYVYDLEGLYNSYQGRVIWGTDDEVENEKNYARYVEILEEITEYVHNKYGSTYKSGGSIRKFSNGGEAGSELTLYELEYYDINGKMRGVSLPMTFREAIDRAKKELKTNKGLYSIYVVDNVSNIVKYVIDKGLYKNGKKYANGGSIRKFSNGGGTGSDPQIYVVDEDAYSKGRDIGEWLTLTDYDDGDEVIEKIEELMLKWSRRQKKKVEEYLIAESINIDDSLISESMDADDFTKAIQVSKAEQSSSIPVDVLIQVYDDFSPDDLADWIDNNYWGRADDDEDLARRYLDGAGNICEILGDRIEYYFDYEKFGNELSSDYSEYDGYYFSNYKRGGSIPNRKLRKQH